MFNGEMSCRPRSQHPAPGPGYQVQTSARAPPPGPEGAGLRNTSPFPGRLPARPELGPRGSPRLPRPEPGQSEAPQSRGWGGWGAPCQNHVNNPCQKPSTRPGSPTPTPLAAGGLGGLGEGKGAPRGAQPRTPPRGTERHGGVGPARPHGPPSDAAGLLAGPGVKVVKREELPVIGENVEKRGRRFLEDQSVPDGEGHVAGLIWLRERLSPVWVGRPNQASQRGHGGKCHTAPAPRDAWAAPGPARAPTARPFQTRQTCHMLLRAPSLTLGPARPHTGWARGGEGQPPGRQTDTPATLAAGGGSSGCSVQLPGRPPRSSPQ
ncbi:collagen alpha-1(III) chain-like [Leopardus geoffroyi]|uniref:collagen alpha-1(III) chain-like n=1 Tax=Leopardus geoffroyi TaxID=46844 RepID=UPI001E264118|nr:collagen alpha-1(III) chain-like [Leopardus geoffroyi]